MAAIIILMLSQTLAQLIASVLVLVKVPEGICNMIAGVLYVGLAFGIMKIFTEKIMKVGISDLGMPQFAMKGKWILIAVLLPLVVKGTYLLFFPGEYVSSEMNGNQIFKTLSVGIVFTGIAAGFVEEMVFRGVI